MTSYHKIVYVHNFMVFIAHFNSSEIVHAILSYGMSL